MSKNKLSINIPNCKQLSQIKVIFDTNIPSKNSSVEICRIKKDPYRKQREINCIYPYSYRNVCKADLMIG